MSLVSSIVVLNSVPYSLLPGDVGMTSHACSAGTWHFYKRESGADKRCYLPHFFLF